MRLVSGRTTQLAAIFATFTLASCGDGPSAIEDQVATVIVSSPQTQLLVGGTVQLVATLLNQTGATIGGSRPVTWTSSSETIATVSTGGLVTGRSAGSARISAKSGDRSASVELQVLPVDCTPATSRTIGSEEVHSGTLTANDCLFVHEVPAQGWRLDLASTTSLQIDLTSSSFDALVVVTDLQMNILTWDDDSGGGTNARLLGTFAAGQYIVWATGFGPASRGPYQLSTQVVTIPLCTSPVGTLAVGQLVPGTLSSDDCLLNGVSFADPWLLVVPATATLRIDLTSQDFDAFLWVTDRSGGMIAGDDDGGEVLNARVVHTFAPGEYLILATSYWPGSTGSYQLVVDAASGSSPSLGAAGPHAGRAAQPFRKLLERAKRE
ncbi:MAG TPA: Ig-like domain-containing protein [Gemmatimonadaceae bacterium]|nr:Ig-like domain-containing protein [Gemmatimonadaceae bacterium]